ncbi:MAG TPA: MBL fold metallo-hydrolase, partial [Gemmataceae bacterium]|nr:MBL fold metallo-hydrolase [Gemmataceae bacterium]
MSDAAEAASVLLTRGRGSPQVYAVRRSEALRFFGGFIAFPGGRVGPADAALDPPLDGRRAAAARELFEETGVLVARRPDDSFPAGPDLEPLRRELLADRLPFADVLGALGARVRAEDFARVGDLVTPPFTAVRFDTTFFVAHLPPGQEPVIWPGELDAGWWETAQTLLARWKLGELVSPPTVSLLQAVEGLPIHLLPERLAPLLASIEAGAIHPIYFAPGVRMIPLRTIALAPATHTNAFLVGGESAYLLDPGPADPAEQGRLFDILDSEQAAGRRLAAVVLTHHHPDHIGAAGACAERYGVPVWAHPWTAERLRGKVAVSRLIDEGDRVELGAAADGAPGWHLRAVHTPGHAPGHLAFYDPHYRFLYASDMVSTLTSIVIAPPEGDLAVYLDSLRRLMALDSRLLLPAHGGPSSRPRQTLEEALAHRAKREAMLLAALGPAPRTVPDLAVELYKGLPAPLMRFAELQVLAGLEKLQREGRAESAGAGWRRPLSSGTEPPPALQ